MSHTRAILSRMVGAGALGFGAAALFVLALPVAVGADSVLPVAPAPRPTTDLYGDPLPPGAVARFGSVRLRHVGLTDYFVRPDGKTARTVGRDGFLRTWDLTTGRQTEATALQGEFAKATGSRDARFPGEGERITDEPEPHLLFSPDRRFLAAVFTRRVVIWDANTGRELKHIPRPKASMERGVFSPNGESLVVRETNAITLLEWRTGRERPVKFPVAHTSPGFNLCQQRFSPDGRYLIVSNAWQGPVRVFEVDGLWELYTREQSGHCLTASPDGKWLAIIPWQRAGVLLLDLPTGKERDGIATTDRVTVVAFSPDSETLAVGERTEDRKGIIRLLDPATRKERARYELDSALSELSFSPDGKTIACVLWSRVGVLIDTGTARVTRCPNSYLRAAVFSPDGKTLVGPGNGYLRVWDAVTGRERHDHPAEIVPWADDDLNLAVSPNARVQVASRRDRVIRLWDPSDGRLIRQLEIKGGSRGAQLAFATDGETVVAADDQGVLQYLDARTGAERRTVRLEFPEVLPNQERGHTTRDVWVSPDLRRAVTSSRGEVTRLLIRDLAEGGSVRSVVFNGEVCAWAWPHVAVRVPKDRGTGLAIVSAMTGRTRLRFPGFVPVGGPVAFSPDGRLLAVPEEGYTQVVVRETATGRAVATLSTGRARGLAFTPDNRTLLTAGPAGLRVWDLATGAERIPRSGRERAPDEIPLACERVILTADGRKAITDAADGTGLVWDLSTFPTEPLEPVTDETERTACWADLLGDGSSAYAAVWRLSESRSGAVVQFLGTRLKPVVGPDSKVVGRLIADLGNDDFPTREAAQGQLAKLGPLAGAELRRAASTNESPEVRDRAAELLRKMPDPIPKGEVLRTVRAIAILERIGSVEARKVLSALAAGANGARETEEAHAALERLTAGAAQP